MYIIKVEKTDQGVIVTPRYMLAYRLCVYRNLDAERESLRIDAAVISYNGFRALYSIAAVLGFITAKGEIRDS